MGSLCHFCATATHLSYRFFIFETSATALCGTTGRQLQQLQFAQRRFFWGHLGLFVQHFFFNKSFLVQNYGWNFQTHHHGIKQVSTKKERKVDVEAMVGPGQVWTSDGLRDHIDRVEWATERLHSVSILIAKSFLRDLFLESFVASASLRVFLRTTP